MLIRGDGSGADDTADSTAEVQTTGRRPAGKLFTGPTSAPPAFGNRTEPPASAGSKGGTYPIFPELRPSWPALSGLAVRGIASRPLRPAGTMPA
jgi:hypothetical protein